MNTQPGPRPNTLDHRAGFAAGILLVALLAGCGEKNTFVAPPPPKVTVQSPIKRDQIIFLEFPGSIEAELVSKVEARVSGFLEKVHFNPGDEVKEGDLLFEIEDIAYAAGKEAADADLAKATADAGIKETTLARLRQAGTGVAKIEVDVAAAELKAAKADVMVAEAALQQAENDLSYTQVHVQPGVTGRISESLVDLGNVVGRPDSTLLATIVKDDRMFVYFDVDERKAINLLGGKADSKNSGRDDRDPIEIQITLAGETDPYPDKASVDFYGNRLDPATGTLRIRCVIPNPDRRLADGLFAKVGVPTVRKDAILVPAVALQRDLAGFYVVTVGEDSKATRKNVEVGEFIIEKDAQLRVIKSGLDGTERVIVIGLQRARDGATVQVAEAGSPPVTAPAPEPDEAQDPTTK
jgi:RND family efflux transporter MFP subunit